MPKTPPDNCGIVQRCPPDLPHMREKWRVESHNREIDRAACPSCHGWPHADAEIGAKSCATCGGTGDRQTAEQSALALVKRMADWSRDWGTGLDHHRAEAYARLALIMSEARALCPADGCGGGGGAVS